jgi:hypothetical protein
VSQPFRVHHCRAGGVASDRRGAALLRRIQKVFEVRAGLAVAVVVHGGHVFASRASIDAMPHSMAYVKYVRYLAGRAFPW